MKKLKFILLAVISIIMSACNHQESDAPKYLVLYYSQTGATKAVAEEIQNALNADIELIEVEEPYVGTYDETIQRCIAEREGGIIPAIKPVMSDIASYDVVFLGYPVWFGTYARPIMGLLDVEDFEGVKVVPFCTFGSGGLEATAEDLRKALPKAEIAEGYGVRNARISAMPDEVNRFLVEQGYKEGAVVALPEFSEQATVTEDEVAVFDAACSDYKYPLGTPVTVGSREVGTGKEYKFTAQGTTPDGREATTTVYVLTAEGQDPVFTKVVR